MTYGIDTTPFLDLDERVRELPDQLPTDPRVLEGVLFSYLRAIECLLSLVMALLEICVERQEKRQYVLHFLPVFDQAVQKLLELLREELREGLEGQSENLIELTYAIRDAQVSAELLALDRGLSQSEGTVEPEDHLNTATTVTNSLKEQIEKHTKRKWIQSVLHTINEVISIVRGVM